MHIADGTLTRTAWQVTTFAGALAATYSIRAAFAEDSGGWRSTVRMVCSALAVFVAQIFTMPGSGPLPAHLIGAFAIALVLGPGTAGVVMGTVIVGQALGFGDGAVSTLGANFSSMGFVAVGVGVAVFEAVRLLGRDLWWSVGATLVGGAASVFSSALVAGLAVAFGKAVPVAQTVGQVLRGAAPTAAIEGGICAFGYAAASLLLPELIRQTFRVGTATPPPTKRPHRKGR